MGKTWIPAFAGMTAKPTFGPFCEGSKILLPVIFPLHQADRLGGTYLRANRIPHVATAVTLDRHLYGWRGVNNAKGAYHHTHPTGNAGGLVHVDQSGLRVPAHRSVGTSLDTGWILAMPALQGKLLSLLINPGNRMGLFINRRGKLLGYKGE